MAGEGSGPFQMTMTAVSAVGRAAHEPPATLLTYCTEPPVTAPPPPSPSGRLTRGTFLLASRGATPLAALTEVSATAAAGLPDRSAYAPDLATAARPVT